MKYVKMIGLAALSAMALMAFIGVGTASATTLEVNGTKQTAAVTITSTIKSGTSAVLKDTFGFSLNTCTESEVSGSTEKPFTGETVTGAITTLSFGGPEGKNCTDSVTVHKPGKLHIKWTSETNGTVTSSGAEVTSFSTAFGSYLNCKTGEGTHLGTLTGVKEGHATMHINAVLTCSGISAKWEGTYVVTSPTGLGVVS